MYLDSTRGAHEKTKVPRALGNWYKRDRAEKKGEDLHADEWPIEYWDCPQQENGFDCGVFVAKYCECLGRGDDFSFSQDHKGTLRRRLVVEICRKHVPARYMGAARGGRRALAFRGAAGERGSELRLRASAGFGLAGRRGGDCAGPDRRNSLALINLNSVQIT